LDAKHLFQINSVQDYSVNNFFYITCQTDADGKQSLIVNAWTIVEVADDINVKQFNSVIDSPKRDVESRIKELSSNNKGKV